MKIVSKEMSDAFWQEVTRFLPAQPERPADRPFARRGGAGRKRKPDRVVFAAILFVLRTGCSWKALPFERFGSASTVHKRFLEWDKAGVFEAIWNAGLAERDEMDGIAWSWQEAAGQYLLSTGRKAWRPVVARRMPARQRDDPEGGRRRKSC